MPRPRIAHQYPFRRRLDRQWVALRLAGGIPPERIAAIEQAELGAVHGLLGDRSFQRLVGAWREHLAVGEAERLARLTRIALDVLELALVNGDRRAAAFFMAERTAGRHPGRTLASAVETALAKAADPGFKRPWGEASGRAGPHDHAPEPAAVAVAAGDPAVAAEAATAHTLRSLARTRLKLKRRLMAEAEREAVVDARPADVLAEHGLRDPGAWVEAVVRDPAGPLPDAPADPGTAPGAAAVPPPPNDPRGGRARAARLRVTRAVHRYALARLGERLRRAAEADRLVDVVGERPGRTALDTYWALAP